MNDPRHENHAAENRLLDLMIEAVKKEKAGENAAGDAVARLAAKLGETSFVAQPPPAVIQLVPRPESQPRAAVPQIRNLKARGRFVRASLGIAASLAVLFVAAALMTSTKAQAEAMQGAGDLLILGADSQPVAACPLEHTDVQADLTGLVGRVTVKQSFFNSAAEKIEAVYMFPLPENAAVDAMTIIVAGRRIEGKILPKPEARAVYNQARAQGNVAGLLDQERPNIFTQSVANIPPAARVEVEISYVQTLKYEDGALEFTYPMTIAPRYNPSGIGAAVSVLTGPPDMRAGHDIALTVRVDAGLAIQNIASKLHEVAIDRPGATQAVVALKDQRDIPNRDFILRVETATAHIGDALLAQTDPRGTFVTLILEPPKFTPPSEILPKELIFVIDRSGSMNGWKIEKAKAAMLKCLDGMGPEDSFNLISFSGGVGKLFESAQPATPENVRKGRDYLAEMQSGGGTEMMPAIMEALAKPGVVLGSLAQANGAQGYQGQVVRGIVRKAAPAGSGIGDGPALASFDGKTIIPIYDPQGALADVDDNAAVVAGLGAPYQESGRLAINAIAPERVRCVAFMTDGEIGNDFAILDAIRANAGTTRVFSFGVGDSTNRYLLENMAKLGRGSAQFVDSSADPAEAAGRFSAFVNAPILTDVQVDWGSLPVGDLEPSPLPDLFSAKPVMVHARLAKGADPKMLANAQITLRGRTAGGLFERPVKVNAAQAPKHGSPLGALWARARIEALMNEDLQALQNNVFPDAIKEQIVGLAMEFGLMTQFTSFVAVEDFARTEPGMPKRIDVASAAPKGERPVNVPSGIYDPTNGTLSWGSVYRFSALKDSNVSMPYGSLIPMDFPDGDANWRFDPEASGAMHAATDSLSDGKQSPLSIIGGGDANNGILLSKSPAGAAGAAPNRAAPMLERINSPVISDGPPASASNYFVFQDALAVDKAVVDQTMANDLIIWSYGGSGAAGPSSYSINGRAVTANAALPPAPLAPASAIGPSLPYDPTNGSTSTGDVYKHGEESFSVPQSFSTRGIQAPSEPDAREITSGGNSIMMVLLWDSIRIATASTTDTHKFEFNLPAEPAGDYPNPPKIGRILERIASYAFSGQLRKLNINAVAYVAGGRRTSCLVRNGAIRVLVVPAGSSADALAALRPFLQLEPVEPSAGAFVVLLDLKYLPEAGALPQVLRMEAVDDESAGNQSGSRRAPAIDLFYDPTNGAAPEGWRRPALPPTAR